MVKEGTYLIKEAPAIPDSVSDMQLRAPHGTENWLMYGGNFKAWRYSALSQISKSNVKSLKLAWKLETGNHDAFEASPLVINGVMYFTTPWNHVYAVNAKNGEVYWRYVHILPKSLPLCCGAVNRGVAVADGKVFFGTLDAQVVALDARTGKKAWQKECASKEDGYSFTVAPMAINGKIILGVSGGDFGVRAFIDALNVKDGSHAWRFWCVPSPGEPGHDSWSGSSWEHGGGAAWMPVTYDPQSKLIYAGVGNPGPDLNGDNRKGDNLYTESTVAIREDDGKYQWHFQMIPHDVWDLDNVTETVLDDITVDGKQIKAGLVASKNGFFYVLDRTTGKCVYAIQYVHKVNWGTVDPDGTPHPDPKMFPVKDTWTVVYPGASGGKEWVPVAYDPVRKRVFIPVIENPHRHKLTEQQFIGGYNYWGGISETLPGQGYGHVCAIDVEKKKIAWDKNTDYPVVCGMACTATGLVITGTPDQKMQIYDADNGDILYEWKAISGWHSAPVVYAVDGEEYIAFPNGWGGWVAGFDAEGAPELGKLPKTNTLYVFSLTGSPKKGGR